MAMRYATLNVLEGPLKGQSLPITAREVTVGRADDCQILLGSYNRVSRRHARLRWERGAFVVEDLDSTNGTLVDGHQVKSARLTSGSRVELGDFAAELWVPPGKPQFAPTDTGAITSRRRIAAGLWGRLPGPAPWRIALIVAVVLLLPGLALRTRHPEDRGDVAKVDPLFDGGPSPGVGRGAVALPRPALIVPSAPVDGKISPAAVKAAKDATVLIAHRSGSGFAFGSGFAVGDPRHIITNRHVVVDDAGRVVPCVLVFACGTPAQTRVAISPHSIRLAAASAGDDNFTGDLAVITLESPVTPALPLGRTEDLTETDQVYALGFPLGIETLTLGEHLPSVSVKAEGVERLQQGQVNGKNAVTVLQLGGTVTHGNSGGPVVNNRGEVVGVISRGAEGTGMSYSIPSAFIEAL